MPLNVSAQDELRWPEPRAADRNDALFRGGGAEFYQYIIRDFKGVKSKPWQGGRYGFVRNPVETSSGLLYTRFHEGIDIRPVRRDAAGEPLDEVRAIAERHRRPRQSRAPSYSNYGNYVVVEHRWDNASYYSLYAHLASVDVQTGHEGRARRAARPARLHRRRARSRARACASRAEPAAQPQLRVVARSLHQDRSEPPRHLQRHQPHRHRHRRASTRRCANGPSLTIPQFLAEEETFYRVKLPPSNELRPAESLSVAAQTRGRTGNAGAWEVSFNRAGVPLEVPRGRERGRRADCCPT